MANSEENEVNAVPVNTAAAIAKAEAELNFLGMICFAEHFVYLFPTMYLAIWDFMKSKVHLVRDFSKLAIGIPRGFAKTALMKLWIIYCVLFTTKKFILVISSNEDHAINIIKDVCDILSSVNITNLFGDWKLNAERNQVQSKIFKFRGRRIVLAAMGANGSIRGLNVGLDRPDVMILDDYQTKKESNNETISEELYKELIGTILKANSPFGCLYIFVANMYPTQGSILKKLKNNKDWLSFIVGAILSNGTSLWEQLQPLSQLLDEYEADLNAGHPEIFLSEKLNDETAGIKAGIDITKIEVFEDEGDLPQGRAIVIDPALDNPTSDYNGIGLVGLYDGKPVLEKVILERFSPLELIKQSLILAFQTGTRLIVVESVAYQASLLFWFSKVCQDNGIEGFHFMPLKIGGGSKNAKIMATLQELAKKEIALKKEVKPLAVNEIIKFQPLKKNNQDTCLDLLSFMKKVVEQYADLMLMVYEADYQMIQGAAPLTELENSPF